LQSASIDPNAALLRAFAVEFLTCQQWAVLPHIMASDYRLNVGGHLISGRETQYRAAMQSQFAQFPGLGVTVHEAVLTPDAIAMRFTEHGASRRDADRRATWQGVALFRVADGQLRVGWAEEDYIARKRQLSCGICDPIEPPHPAPWDVQTEPTDPAAENAARDWLLSSLDPPTVIDVSETQIDELFGTAGRVAFHITQRGTYAGGLADIVTSVPGAPVTLRSAGLLTMCADTVSDVRIVSDHLGLQRSLRTK
jgi:predicted ester cyclase